MSFTNPQFTNEGKKLQARALAGECTITFTTMGLGDGELTTGSISALVDLINTVKRVNISDLKIINPDQVQLKSVFQNIDLDTGFFWREVGLFAADPDNPDDRTKDILYCYQNAGNLAEYIPSASSQLVDKILNMSVVVADASTVKISFFSESYALKEDLDEQTQKLAQNLENHKNDENAHSNLAHYTDTNAHSYLFSDVILYVNAETGSDDNDGLTETKAKKTINGALNALPVACRLANIIVAEGTYNEDVKIPYSRCGTLTIESPDGQTATINSVLACSLDYFLLKNINVIGNSERNIVIYTSNFRLEGVTITNGSNVENGVIAQYGSGLLTNCNISGFDKGVHAAYGASVAVRSSTFSENTLDLYAYDAQIFVDNDNLTRDSVAGGSVICGSVGKALTLGGLVRTVNGVTADASGNVTIQGASCIPDYSSGIDITSKLKTSPYSYTAPCNGTIKFYVKGDVGFVITTKPTDSNSNSIMYIDSQTGVYITSYLTVGKGQTIYANIYNSGDSAVFYPFK